MTVENYLQETGALATLAGILGGFAFSAVVQLLSNENKSKLYTSTIVVFSASTVMFLYSLVVFVLIFAATAELNSIPTELDTLGISALLVVIGAVLVFLAGISITGWIRSKIAGIASTAFAVITTCLILFAFAAVISIFPTS
jgi:hypothetical protein